jgi:hypothetical protein
MKLSEMSLQDIWAIFDHPENYPLRVTIDGQTVELSPEAVAELRRRQVDFDVDEAQVVRILRTFGTC